MKTAFFFDERIILNHTVLEDIGLEVHTINMGEYSAEGCLRELLTEWSEFKTYPYPRSTTRS